MSLLDLVELVSKARHALRFDNVVQRLTRRSFLAKGFPVIWRTNVFHETVVNLADTRLNLGRLAVLLDVLRSLRALVVLSVEVNILSDAVVGIVLSANGHVASGSESRVGVLAHPSALHSSSNHSQNFI